MLSALSETGLRVDQVKPAPADDPKVDKFILQKGDILISRANTRKLVGLAAMYKGEPPNCIYSDLMMRIRVDDKIIDGIFLEHWLRHPYVRAYFSTHAKGTSESMVKINQKIVEKLIVPLPPLSEQKQIAEILSTVDRKLELLRKRREKLERIKRGLMKDLLTGRRRVRVE